MPNPRGVNGQKPRRTSSALSHRRCTCVVTESSYNHAENPAPEALIRPWVVKLVQQGYKNEEIVLRLRTHYNTQKYNLSYVYGPLMYLTQYH